MTEQGRALAVGLVASLVFWVGVGVAVVLAVQRACGR